MRILIRAGKAPHDIVGPEASFARNRSGVFGANVGNLLFTNAVFRALNTPESEIVPDSLESESPRVTPEYVARINTEFDRFVLPLANAFRPQFRPWLDRLTSVIEKLDIPVNVVGVGAQLNVKGDFSGVPGELNDSVKKFMKAVLDRSTSVGVRGELTRGYLASLGFGSEHVRVIGCPSMYDGERSLSVSKLASRLNSSSKLAINITPSVNGMGEVLVQHAKRYKNSIYVPQEHRELAMLLWGKDVTGSVDPGVPSTIAHPLYRQDRIRFFLDPKVWRAHLADFDFAFGNRIHGNIAAITAGVPAVLLSHDSRTLELARYHELPYRLVEDLDRVDAAELYEWADYSALNKVSVENFDRYVNFLDENDLPNIHTPGNANSDYARLLADVPFPPPVGTLYAADRSAVVERLRWLWQGVDADQKRSVGAYVPPFKPEVAPKPNAEHERAKRDAESLSKKTQDLEAKLREHDAILSYLKQPIEKRAVRGVGTRLRRLFNRS